MSQAAWELGHSLAAAGILLLGLWRWELSPLVLAVWALPAFLTLRYAAYRQRRASAVPQSALANAFTASRLLLVLGVLGWHWATAGAAEPAWMAILLLSLAEGTDYLDGRAARHALRAVGAPVGTGPGPDSLAATSTVNAAGTTTATASGPTFGACFDMEVDAYVTGALALQAVLYRAAPVWLLAAGLWRYAYAIWEAGLTHRWRRAGRRLPCDVRMPAWFRWQAKAICVLSVVLLIALALPGLDSRLAAGLSALVVALMSYSFVISILLLLCADIDSATSAQIRS